MLSLALNPCKRLFLPGRKVKATVSKVCPSGLRASGGRNVRPDPVLSTSRRRVAPPPKALNPYHLCVVGRGRNSSTVCRRGACEVIRAGWMASEVQVLAYQLLALGGGCSP